MPETEFGFDISRGVSKSCITGSVQRCSIVPPTTPSNCVDDLLVYEKISHQICTYQAESILEVSLIVSVVSPTL